LHLRARPEATTVCGAAVKCWLFVPAAEQMVVVSGRARQQGS